MVTRAHDKGNLKYAVKKIRLNVTAFRRLRGFRKKKTIFEIKPKMDFILREKVKYYSFNIL